jgi:hypothetical protein
MKHAGAALVVLVAIFAVEEKAETENVTSVALLMFKS